MITFLSTFKDFVGDDAIGQRNALLSWLALADDVEVLVFGRAAGLGPVVRELGLVHYPEVPCIDNRLPRVDVMFSVGQREGRHDLQAYVNGDIVLGPDFSEALEDIGIPHFLMVGRCWDTNLLPCWKQLNASALLSFRREALRQGRLVGPTAIDYFGFRRGTLGDLPPLVPGAAAWDNFMIEDCRRRGIPVIDATDRVLAIHQEHEYRRSASGEKITFDSPAAEHNRRLTGPPGRAYSVWDASHVLSHNSLRPAWLSISHLRHQLWLFPMRNPRWRPFKWGFRGISKVLGLLERIVQVCRRVMQRQRRAISP